MDHEAGFAVRLARSVNRLDWWNVKAEHTPFQWSLQQAAEIAEPSGETRADMRAAVMTANLLVMQAANKEDMTQEQFSQIINGLMSYLRTSAEVDDEIGREALAKLKKGE